MKAIALALLYVGLPKTIVESDCSPWNAVNMYMLRVVRLFVLLAVLVTLGVE